MLCFRGDSRPPSLVFKNGFSPRKLSCVNANNGLSKAILPFPNAKAGQTINLVENFSDKRIRVCGIDQDYAICMSRRFEVAAVFPTTTAQKTYVYAVVMPEAIRFSSMENFFVPYFQPGQVFDLHSLQIQEAHFIAKREQENKYYHDHLYAAYALYAHEVFTSKVLSENILAAFEVERAVLEGEYIYAYEQNERVPLRDLRTSNFQKKFRSRLLIFNDRSKDLAEYGQELTEIDKKFNSHEWSFTPSISSGLGGTFLPLPDNDQCLGCFEPKNLLGAHINCYPKVIYCDECVLNIHNALQLGNVGLICPNYSCKKPLIKGSLFRTGRVYSKRI